MKKINEQKISGNLDTPEGGFDALMQVASCNDTLKWQAVELAHRLVVFVTDASPHIAGDGKLGGITLPNDGGCHLGSKNSENPKTYTRSNTLDYPSISKLKSKLKENSIIPIFAVTEAVQPIYQKIAMEWKDLNAAIGVLEGDSSNIVDLIKEKYSEIIKTIRMSDNSPPDIHLKYKTDSSCVYPSENGAVCTNITAGQVYGFDVLVTAAKCPKDSKDVTLSFSITVPGLGKIDVEVNLFCQCPCESLGHVNSTICNGSGTFQCGICQCNPGHFGDGCICTKESEADDSLCKQTNSTTFDIICSGVGTCVCGRCECNKRMNPGEFISGKFCECNNYGCDRFNDKLCGGPERGICECGRCKCKDNYLGDNCGEVNCTASYTKCFHEGELCNGHGICDCDQCVCEKGYAGRYCEECLTCPGKCSAYRDCLECLLDRKGPLMTTNCTSCSHLDVQQTEHEINGYCRYQIDTSCYYDYDFISGDFENETILYKKACIIIDENTLPVLYIIIGVISGIVFLVFLMLLFWKIIITAYDNYEYQKFIKNKPHFKKENENRIYKAPKTVYDNPTYANNPYA